MDSNHQELLYFEHELLTVEGQITLLLVEGEKTAGDIYLSVKASQPTISKKIARMLDQGMIEQRTSARDRRVPIYSISEEYRQFLLGTKISKSLSSLKSTGGAGDLS